MNLTPAKLTGGRILQISDRWRTDAHLVDLDRAELNRHYNGGAIEEQAEDFTGKPTIRRANMLLGYKFLSRPTEQLLAAYDDGVGFLEAKVTNPNLEPARRLVVQAHLNREVNRIIQKSERLYWPWRATVGDAIINGIGVMYRDDPYDWAPKYGRPYFGWDAPADITDDRFSDWCFLGHLGLSEIIARLDKLKSVAPEDSYWDREKLVAAAEAIAKRHISDHSPFQPLIHDDPLTWREWLQTQSWGDAAMASSVPVVWFFAKRFDAPDNKRPIDLYCVPRWGEVASEHDNKLSITRNPKSGEHSDVLFYQPNLFEDVLDCLFPFQLSCMVGGEPLMRRTMGLGALMYDLDIRVQSSINNMFDATDFDFSPLFQATDQQSELELEALSGTRIRPYDIMPSGAKFMEKPKGNRPYSSVFELTQLMSNEMGAQAQSFHGGGDFESKGRAELEVQVLERRQQLATALRLRMGDFIRRADPLACAIGHTLVNEDSLIQTDKAWPQREALKKALAECNVEWEEVEGQCTFAMRRPPGHGDPGLALFRAQQTEAIARGLGPEAHRIAQRNLLAAINGGDTQFAEQMVPSQKPQGGRQEQDALAQSAQCLATFVPAQRMETDDAMAHVPVHLLVLQSHAAVARESGGRWSRAAQRGFEALAAHTLLDVQALGAYNPQQAREAEKGVQQLVREVSQFEVSDGQPQIDPVEQAKLQLQQRAQQAKEVKMADDISHRQRAQEHREENAAFQQNLQLAHLSEVERTGQVNRASTIVKTARDIAPEPPASNNAA